MKTIDEKIVAWYVKGEEVVDAEEKTIMQTIQGTKRPFELDGTTYKIRPPIYECAFYITITNQQIAGRLYPREIFINSKHMENFQWVVALTRCISAIFRNGEDPSYLIEELKSVFDPRGGYYKPGGKYMPSLVAEIGEIIEMHLMKIGAIEMQDVPEELLQKRIAAEEKGTMNGTQCPKCFQMAVTRLDGCDTCLECGYSKCG